MYVDPLASLRRAAELGFGRVHVFVAWSFDLSGGQCLELRHIGFRTRVKGLLGHSFWYMICSWVSIPAMQLDFNKCYAVGFQYMLCSWILSLAVLF